MKAPTKGKRARSMCAKKHVIPNAAMQRFYRNQQQPVYEEGFDIVHVDGNKRLAFVDLEKLGKKGE